MLISYLAIFLGGGLGSATRFTVSSFTSRQIISNFPWYTLSVNLLGAFLIGVIIELTTLKFPDSVNMKYLLVTGFLGGFTTFSTFSLESTLMWSRGDYLLLTEYVLASVIGTILLVFIAMNMTKALLVSI